MIFQDAVILRESLLMQICIVLSMVFAGLLATVVINSHRACLSHLPGPFIARYTNLWSAYVAWKTTEDGTKAAYFRRLRARYGDVIRVGPRSVCVMDPAAVPLIYGVRAKLDKGEAYIAFRRGGAVSLLTTLDETEHAQYRRLVANAYALSSLKAYELKVDEMIEQLMNKCDEYAKSKKAMNLSLWCRFFCFDVVSILTLGYPLGFLTGADVLSLNESLDAFGKYASIISQVPWLHKLLAHPMLQRNRKPSPFIEVVRKTVDDNLDNLPEENNKPHVLAHFVNKHRQDSSRMTKARVLSSTSGNLVAGALSPSKAFSEICFWLATNPQSQERLCRELEEAHIKNSAEYDALTPLPYLEGTIKEALRLHTSASSVLQRVTGAGGLQLPSGIELPAGTNIGCPSGAVNQDPSIFGADSEAFRPDRWMRGEGESEGAFEERRKVMDRTELSFGQGSRACIGRNIALMEMFKGVANLVGKFKFEAVGVPRSKKEVYVTVRRRE